MYYILVLQQYVIVLTSSYMLDNHVIPNFQVFQFNSFYNIRLDHLFYCILRNE